jgi:hypothetical protein
MRSLVQRAAVLALLPSLGLCAVAGSAAAAPSPSQTGASVTKTRICVTKKSKRARVVRTTEKCVRGETRMTWKRYQDFASSSAGNSSASTSDDTPAVGPAGPQGLTGETGPTGARGPAGSNGNTGATGATGEKGATGATGETGARGPQGAAGPSDVYTTTGTSSTVGLTEDATNRAALSLPAGSYFLMGQVNLASSSDLGQFFVTCRLRQSGTLIGQSDESAYDNTTDGIQAAQANLLITAPLVTSGATVTLRCQSFLGLPLASDVQLTAIQTGALHIQ